MGPFLIGNRLKVFPGTSRNSFVFPPRYMGKLYTCLYYYVWQDVSQNMHIWLTKGQLFYLDSWLSLYGQLNIWGHPPSLISQASQNNRNTVDATLTLSPTNKLSSAKLLVWFIFQSTSMSSKIGEDVVRVSNR